jgi:hypothetical protein
MLYSSQQYKSTKFLKYSALHFFRILTKFEVPQQIFVEIANVTEILPVGTALLVRISRKSVQWESHW